MPISRLLRVVISWIACTAMLMGALAPAISHAALRDVPAGWVEICSVTGAKFVRAVEGGTRSQEPVESPVSHAMQHCPYCALHAPLTGLPPAQPAGLRLLALGFEQPALFLQSPRPLFAWASAQPRAPPARA
jgi:hypothetical protein